MTWKAWSQVVGTFVDALMAGAVVYLLFKVNSLEERIQKLEENRYRVIKRGH